MTDAQAPPSDPTGAGAKAPRYAEIAGAVSQAECRGFDGSSASLPAAELLELHQWHAVVPASVNVPTDGRKSQSYEFACKVSSSTPWLVSSRTSEFGWGAPNG